MFPVHNDFHCANRRIATTSMLVRLLGCIQLVKCAPKFNVAAVNPSRSACCLKPSMYLSSSMFHSAAAWSVDATMSGGMSVITLTTDADVQRCVEHVGRERYREFPWQTSGERFNTVLAHVGHGD